MSFDSSCIRICMPINSYSWSSILPAVQLPARSNIVCFHSFILYVLSCLHLVIQSFKPSHIRSLLHSSLLWFTRATCLCFSFQSLFIFTNRLPISSSIYFLCLFCFLNCFFDPASCTLSLLSVLGLPLLIRLLKINAFFFVGGPLFPPVTDEIEFFTRTDKRYRMMRMRAYLFHY